MGPAQVSDRGEPRSRTRLLYTDQEVAEELERFSRAVDQTEEELTRLKEEIAGELKEHAHLLELHLLILRDRMLLQETQRLIQEQNFNAERALYQAFLKIKELFQRIGDKHIRGRIQDVEAVYHRLLGHLTGKSRQPAPSFAEPVIIVARDLSPAETTQMSKDPRCWGLSPNGAARPPTPPSSPIPWRFRRWWAWTTPPWRSRPGTWSSWTA